MSNGEDVIDSWEEIDEAELEKSLQLQKTGKEQPQQQQQKVILNNSNFGQMKLLLRPALDAAGSNPKNDSNADNELSALDTMSDSLKPVIMMLNNTNDEYQSVNYTAPIANQTVKILRRPTQQNERRNGIAKPKQPIKTLQQREQEYAEARLRIMGAAKNPDDDLANMEKQKKATSVNVPITAKPSTSETATSSLNVWEKQETTIEKPLPPYAFMENNVAAVYGGNFSKTNFLPPQNYCYPGVPPPAAGPGAAGCADIYGHRAMTMMTMPPPQPPLISAQTYPHLNTALYPLHQQNRQFHKQYSLPSQNMQQKAWPTIMNSGVSGIGNTPPPHPKLLQQQQQQREQQQQQQKVVYLKTHNNNNKTNNQNQVHNSSIQNESILRLPRGPDGSHGFQMRR